MSKKLLLPALTMLTAAVLSAPAEAHLANAAGASLAEGLAHPLAGLDHLLAMATVGLWAAQRGGRALWLLPLAFLAAMSLGVLGLGGVALPGTELAIAASLLGLGLALALAAKPALWLGVALVGAAGLAHGHAHGSEMPLAVAPVLYALGVLATTAALHAAGIAAGRLLARPLALRLAGAAVAFGGVALAVG